MKTPLFYTMKMKRIKFYTLGCRLNRSETSVLESVFARKGYDVVRGKDAVDIVVLNSCTVTGAGDDDARKLVARIHREFPLACIAVIGCQAQIQREAILSWPGVRWVVGTGKKMQLPDIIGNDLLYPAGVIVPRISRRPFSLPLSTRASTLARANLKVQDGCDNFCSFCEIPYARGRSRSRVFDNVLAEARALAALGHREVVLTGVNVGSYHDSGRGLVDIVRALHSVRGLDRIRISSIEHDLVPLDLCRFMMPAGKLCRHLHLPVQSGSDTVLRKMKRGYSSHHYLEMLHKLNASVPGIMIGTDVIVGFPGETDHCFEETFSFLKESPVTYFHVFSYSARHRARSRLFSGQVPEEKIRLRSGLLRKLSNYKKKIFLERLLGQKGLVLFEQKKGDYWVGHTDNYVKIKTINSKNLRNNILTVFFERLDGDSLVGTVQ